MITPWTIYWMTRLDEIKGTAMAAFIISIIGAMICYICYGLKSFVEDEEAPALLIYAKRLLIVSVLSSIPNMFIPSTKEMAAILVIPAIANNQQVQDIGKELGDLAKSWLNEFKPKGTEHDTK